MNESTSESAEGAKQTASEAEEVVAITMEMKRLAITLTRQMAQFKVKKKDTLLGTEEIEQAALESYN